MVYTGYLRRTVPSTSGAPQFDDLPEGEFLLVLLAAAATATG